MSDKERVLRVIYQKIVDAAQRLKNGDESALQQLEALHRAKDYLLHG